MTQRTRRILITGANRGLGLHLARSFIEAGHRVWGTARTDRPDALRRLGPAGIVAMDVADEASVEAALAELSRRLDGLDVLINNAGVDARAFGAGATERGALDIDAETFLAVHRVNVAGPLVTTRAALPLLRAGDDPMVVNISSQLGSMTAGRRMGGDAAYCSSKAALNMLSLKQAAALEGEGIGVVVLHPGWVSTDMGGSGAALTPEASAAALVDTIGRLTPADSGRFLTWDGRDHPW